MTEFNPQPIFPPTVLATDLDGTFLPMEKNPDHFAALESLKREISNNDIRLIYVTGRHLESVESAVETFQLLVPDWLICDVGTSIYRVNTGKMKLYKPYEDHLSGLVRGQSRDRVEELLSNVTEIALQSPERQQQFKISYECESAYTDTALEEISTRLVSGEFPYTVIGSVDPFEDCGLLDILPAGVSKAYAVKWLAEHADFSPDEVVFAGDSGNDKAALVAGFRAIVVGNASDVLAAEVEGILDQRGWSERFYRSSATATSGVLEGCRHYGLIKD